MNQAPQLEKFLCCTECRRAFHLRLTRVSRDVMEWAWWRECGHTGSLVYWSDLDGPLTVVEVGF